MRDKQRNRNLLNLLSLGIVQLTIVVSNYLIFFLLVRFYDKDILGNYVVGRTFAGILTSFAILGLATALILELAKAKDDTQKSLVFTHCLVIFLSTSLIVVPIGLFVLVRLNYDPAILEVIPPLLIGCWLLTLRNLIGGGLVGLFKMDEQAFLSILSSLVSILAVAPAIYSRASLKTIVSLWAGSQLVGVILGFYILRFRNNMRLTFSNLKLKDSLFLLKRSVLIGLSSLFENFGYNIHLLILGSYFASQQIGLYSGVYKILPLYLFPIRIFINFFRPFLAKEYMVNENKFHDSVIFFHKISMMLTIPLFIFTILFPDVIIKYVLGHKFMEAKTILIMLSLAFILYSLPPYPLLLRVIGKDTYAALCDFVFFGSMVFFTTLSVKSMDLLTICYYVIASYAVYWIFNVTMFIRTKAIPFVFPFRGLSVLLCFTAILFATRYVVYEMKFGVPKLSIVLVIVLVGSVAFLKLLSAFFTEWEKGVIWSYFETLMGGGFFGKGEESA